MKLGISSLGHFVDFSLSKEYKKGIELLLEVSEASLTFAEENNIEVCEILLDPPDIFLSENKKRFIDLCNSFSIKKEVHAPLIDVCMCSINPLISKASVESYIETAKICNQIDANILTIHPGNSFLNQIKTIEMFNRKRLIETVNNLLNATADLGVNICIENMPNAYGAKIFLYFQEIDQFFHDISRNDLFMTWDTSHSWTCNIDLEILWKKFHNVIKNIHLADNFKKNQDTHPALGSGEIDFQEIFDIIKKHNYNGALIVEIASAKDLPKSLDFIKKFL